MESGGRQPAHPFHVCFLVLGIWGPHGGCVPDWELPPWASLCHPGPASTCALSQVVVPLLFQWGLVCDSQHLKPVGQAFFMAGILLGSFTWGLLSYW